METTMNNDMCRCCATVGTFKDIKTKYHWMGEEEIYADMLKDYLDITLAAVDGESNGICEVCITQLRNAANFKKQVQHTEQRFQRHLQDKIFAQNIVKEEASGDEDVDSDNMGDDFVPDYDVSIKSETEDKPKKRTTRASTSKNKIITLDGGESSKKRKEEKISLNKKYNFNAFITISPTKAKERKERHTEIKKLTELDLHTQNIKSILRCSNATPIRCYVGGRYGCDYCLDQFQDATELKKHTLSEHLGDRPESLNVRSLSRFIVILDMTQLQCTICDDLIKSLEELLHHLRDHDETVNVDLKNHIIPFSFDRNGHYCVICEKEFDEFNGVIEHMSLHYKNYVCEFCNVSFIAKYCMIEHKKKVHLV